jgi:hypothetical protein
MQARLEARFGFGEEAALFANFSALFCAINCSLLRTLIMPFKASHANFCLSWALALASVILNLNNRHFD